MSIHQLAIGSGVFSPEDLDLLQGVYDEVCVRNGVLDEEGRAAISRKILLLFQGGTRDRGLLLAVLSMGDRSRMRA